jgi:hypothetical protein
MTDMVASNGMSVIAYWQQRAESAESALAASQAEVARLRAKLDQPECPACQGTDKYCKVCDGRG